MMNKAAVATTATFLLLAVLFNRSSTVAMTMTDDPDNRQTINAAAAAVPTFAKELENTTAVLGREATLSCAIHNLGSFKVAFVRVDTQTILTIDDHVITRSTRISVRHISDASVDPDHHHKQRHHRAGGGGGGGGHHNKSNGTTTTHHHPLLGGGGGEAITASGGGGGGGSVGGGSSSIHKTWQLIIRDVQSADAGLYMCQLNTEPMTSQTAYLSVTVPPDIVDSESSSDVMVSEGANTTLRCTATGHPLPVITWRREDARPIHSHSNHVTTVEGSTLQLTRLTRNSIGAYLCIASNGVPPSVSKRFMLRVQFPPSITAPNQLVGARQGDSNVILECKCESFPKPVVYWLRHGSTDVVVSGGKYREEKRETDHYKVSMQLIFTQLDAGDFMAYQCVCRNTLGLAEAVVRLYQIHSADDSTSNDVYVDQQHQPQDGKEHQLVTWERGKSSANGGSTKNKDESSRKPAAVKSLAVDRITISWTIFVAAIVVVPLTQRIR